MIINILFIYIYIHVKIKMKTEGINILENDKLVGI